MYQTHEDHGNVRVYVCGYTCMAKEMMFVWKMAPIFFRTKCMVHVVFLPFCPVFLRRRCATYLLAFDYPVPTD